MLLLLLQYLLLLKAIVLLQIKVATAGWSVAASNSTTTTSMMAEAAFGCDRFWVRGVRRAGEGSRGDIRHSSDLLLLLTGALLAVAMARAATIVEVVRFARRASPAAG